MKNIGINLRNIIKDLYIIAFMTQKFFLLLGIFSRKKMKVYSQSKNYTEMFIAS